MAAKVTKKTLYFPAKTFDDDYAALADLFKDNKWKFSGIDDAQLPKDVVAQRKERADFDRLESQYLKAKEALGVNQDGRYRRFASALNAVRGAFRDDRTVMKEIEPLKRSATRKSATPK